MKKVFLTLALAAFAFAANAQFVVSGNLGFNHSGEKYTVDGKDDYTSRPEKNNNFYIRLKGGYQITEDFQAGVLLGFSTSKYLREDPDPTDPTKTDRSFTSKSNTISMGVYGRYNLMTFNKFKFFAEGTLGIVMGSGTNETKNPAATVSVDQPKSFGLNIDIVPGASYQINDHLSADLYFNLFALGFHTEKTTADKATTASGTEETYSTTDFGFRVTGLSNALSLGITYRF